MQVVTEVKLEKLLILTFKYVCFISFEIICEEKCIFQSKQKSL